MDTAIPRIVIGGASSGAGKTSVTLGLVAALRRRGATVQTWKVGPDYLDPTYLRRASARLCYNLDGWMTSREYVTTLFREKAGDADIAVVEGVMGLFDGAYPDSIQGSTAEMAIWLNAPVLLVADAHGVAGSFAALVHGFASFEQGVAIGGAIANNCGSERHGDLLARALRAADLPPLAGAVPKHAFPQLQSRHLGLITADDHAFGDHVLHGLADAIERHVNLDLVLDIAQAAGPLPLTGCGAPIHCTHRDAMTVVPAREEGQGTHTRMSEYRHAPALVGTEQAPQSDTRPAEVRIGVARDEAFHFYYPDNLEILAHMGAAIVPFSPLHDQCLPPGLHGLYLGGGYPEAHAAQLSKNSGMLEAIRRFTRQGRPVYAECGGLMYLGLGIQDLEGNRYELAGLLPAWTRMLDRLKSLGYAEVVLSAHSLFGPPGTILRGHEFHYSELVEDPCAESLWSRVYQVRRRRGSERVAEGYARGRILASYVHLHFGSNLSAARAFIAACRDSGQRETPTTGDT